MKIKVRVEGKTPLLINKFSDEAAMQATEQTRVSTPKDRGTPQEQADSVRRADENGKTIVPYEYFMGSMTIAGTYFKLGKNKVSTQKSSILPACVSFDEVYYPLQHKQPWKVDTRPVRNPVTGGRILRHRPCFDDWAVDFEIDVDTTIMPVKLAREIIDFAGNRIGAGDYRPACRGPFGRYVVTHWEEEKIKLKTQY